MKTPFQEGIFIMFLLCLAIILIGGLFLLEGATLFSEDGNRQIRARGMHGDIRGMHAKTESVQTPFFDFRDTRVPTYYFFVTQREQIGVPSSEK